MNKNRRIGMSLALAMALSLSVSGCGSSSGGGGSSSSQTDVTVERGKVYDANVTDSSTPPQLAKEKEGTNIYTFAKAPKYPVVVNGGWIDVNDNGKMDTNDTKLDIEMLSYSNIVTPITTYIADDNATIREQKLQELVAKLNVDGVGSDQNITVSDLLTLPSKAPRDVMILSNATFKDMKEKNTLKPDLSDIMSQFITLDSSVADDANAVSVEESVMDNLENQSLVEKVTPEDIPAVKEVDSSTDEVTVEKPTISTVSTDAGVATETHTSLDLSGYNFIRIYKNIDEKLFSTLVAGFSNYPKFASSPASTSTTCAEYGFNNLANEMNTDGVLYKTYMIEGDNPRFCYEVDYTNAKSGSGSTNMITRYSFTE